MGFAAGALKGLTEPILTKLNQEDALRQQIRQMIAQIAMQGLFDPATDPALRDEYRRILSDDPLYSAVAGIRIPDTPEARLRREVGPLLNVAQVAGALGPLGLLTPDLAEQLEKVAGRRVFPRNVVTEPGAVLEPAFPGALARPGRAGLPPEAEVRAPPTKRETIDVSRFAPDVRIKLHTGQEVSLNDLKGLSGDFVMFLVRGPAAAQARTYGDLFGDALKAEWRGVPIQVNENGRMVFPPEHAFVSPAQQQPARTLGQVFGPAVKPEFQNAPATYDARGQLDYPPANVFVDVDAQRFERARQAWVAAKGRQASDEEAYRAAFAEDPKFPRPATLATPQVQTPQQQAWAQFFSKGWDGLSEGQRAYIESQLREDGELAEALRIMATLRPGDPRYNQLVDAATATIAGKLGLPVEDVKRTQPGWFVQLWRRFFGKGGEDQGRPGSGAAVVWAREQLQIMRAQGNAKTKRDFQREFNKARRHPALKEVPLDYWRVLQNLINQMR